MAVFRDVNWSVGNPGTGSGATESASGYKMLQNAFKNLEGMTTRIDEENKAKGTMELLKMKKEGHNITDADFARVGRYDPLMLEKHLGKLKKYNRDLVTQDRNFGLDQQKTDAYIRNTDSSIMARDPATKLANDIVRAKYNIGTGSKKTGSGSKSKGKGGLNPRSVLNTWLKDKGYEPDDIAASSYAEYERQLRNASSDPNVQYQILTESMNDDSLLGMLPFKDSVVFNGIGPKRATELMMRNQQTKDAGR